MLVLKESFFQLKEKYLLEQLSTYKILLENGNIKNLDMLISKNLLVEGYFTIIDLDKKKFIHWNKEINKKSIKIFEKFNNISLEKALKENSNTFDYKFVNEKGEIEKRKTWFTYINKYNKYLAVSVSLNELRREYYDFIEESFILKILSFSLVCLAIYMYLTYLFSPLQTLNFKIKKFLSSGANEIQNMKINRKDEIGQLFRNFNIFQNMIKNKINRVELNLKTRNEEMYKILYYNDITKLKNKQYLINDIKKESYCTAICLNFNKMYELIEFVGNKKVDKMIIDLSSTLKRFSYDKKINLYHVKFNEFIFLLNNKLSYFDFKTIINELKILLEKTVIFINFNNYINPHFNIGAVFKENECLKKLNTTIYVAKKSKKSDVCIYSKKIETKQVIENNIHWQNVIDEALIKQNITPFFQPIFDKSKNVIKYEALMRIYDESNSEFVSPNKFLDISKKTNQYKRLSYEMIKQSLNFSLQNDVPISINLSYLDFLCSTTLNLIDRKLENSKLAKNVTFEIVENDEIEDYDFFIDRILNYKKKGVKIAIDDFGKGYSNYHLLMKIKPDFIKIDGSLIKNIDRDDYDLNILKMLVKMFQNLNVKIIAELVHNEEIFRILNELNVEGFQGYYLGKPTKKL